MSVIQILLAIVVIVLVIGKRLAGEPLTTKRLVVLPVVLAAIGISGLSKVTNPSPTDVALVALSLVVGLGFGLLRGRSVEVAVRDGYLWYRYRWATIGWWVSAIVARIGLTVVERADHAGHLMSNSLLLGLAVTFLGEAAVVYPRARALGAPFAVDNKRAARSGR